MTDEILNLAKETCNGMVWDGPHLPAEEFTFTPEQIEAFYRAAFNAGIEAAASESMKWKWTYVKCWR
jgi:hypothetical protein